MEMRYFLSEYLLERDLSAGHSQALRLAVDDFARWLGRSPDLADLNDDTLNRWIANLVERGLSRWTVRGLRGRVLTIWRAAYWRDPPLVPFPPRRVRPIKRPKTIPEAWDLQQLALLLSATEKLTGCFPQSRVPRRDFWRAFVLVAYDTGLRLGDLERLRFDQIGPDGSAVVIQHKTGNGILCRLSPESMAAVNQLRLPSRQEVFGHAIARNNLYVRFRELVALAGLSGTTRKLRKTSGSWVERIAPGTGHLQLGNGREVFEAHYKDPRIAQSDRPLPPRIA